MSVITVKIREMAQKAGITTAYQLQKLTGAQPSLAAKWYKNDLKSISFDNLDLLCRKLGCTPNEILDYNSNEPLGIKG
jgi:DNA-binding Xre family transcriptional regulator